MNSERFDLRKDDPATRAIEAMRSRRNRTGRSYGDGSPLINFASNFDVIDGASASQGAGAGGGAGGGGGSGGGGAGGGGGGGGGGCCVPGGPTNVQLNQRMDDASISATCNSDGTITVTLDL